MFMIKYCAVFINLFYICKNTNLNIYQVKPIHSHPVTSKYLYHEKISSHPGSLCYKHERRQCC